MYSYCALEALILPSVKIDTVPKGKSTVLCVPH